jgi:hypothetical protein
VVEEVSPEL